MWFIRWILTLVAVVVLIGFAMQNSDVQVPLRFYKWETVNDLPLWLVMYLSFIAGIIFWLLVSLYQIIVLKAENRRQLKRAQTLERELHRLRNAAVEDMLAPESSEIVNPSTREPIE